MKRVNVLEEAALLTTETVRAVAGSLNLHADIVRRLPALACSFVVVQMVDRLERPASKR
jgi:hypothetical protein